MKHLFLTLFISMAFTLMLSGQEKSLENIPKDILDCLVGMGKDTIPTLNVCESKYLNFYFQKDRGIFNFCGKKVAFFKGNAGTIKSTKKEYFDAEKQFLHQIDFFLSSVSGQLIIFNEEEVKQIGYDAVIVSSSKKLLTNKEVVKRLQKNSNIKSI